MDNEDGKRQEPDMELVQSEEEGFNKAIRLGKNYLEKIKLLLKERNDVKLKEEFEKIVRFVPKEGHGDVFVEDEDGEEEMLLEIVDENGNRKQQIFFAEFEWFRDALRVIWFNHHPAPMNSLPNRY